MAKFKLFLLFILLPLLCGCQENQVSAPTLPACQIYEEMLSNLYGQPILSVSYTEITTMTQGSNTYTYEDRQQLLLDTKTGSFQSTGELCCGPYTFDYEKHYHNSTLYLCLNGSCFKGSFLNCQSLLPQPGMFANHKAVTDQNTTGIYFTDSDAAFWNLPKNAKDIAAEGSLGPCGQNSAQLTYTISYTAAHTAFQTTLHIQYSPSSEPLSHPDEGAYTTIGYVQAPLVLEKAYGLLLQSTHVTANSMEEIRSSVNTLHYSNQLVLKRKDGTGAVISQINLNDYSHPDDRKTVTQEEVFEKGSYSVYIDGSLTQSKSLNQAQFFDYFIQLLSENILASKYIHQATAQITEDGILLTLQPNSALAQNLRSQICQTLYDDAGFLQPETEPVKLVYQLTLDPVAGLPLQCQMEYANDFAIEGIPYSLTAHYRQDFIWE